MANRTVKDAKAVKGTNPQYLVEKIIRSRIYDSQFWKEECFALTAELLVDKAMEIKYVAGVHGGNIQPSPFLCLVLKMLQIQPEKDIIVEFIKNEEFKYVRTLGAFYMRLVGTSLDVYKYLEPLLNDYRKIRRQNRQGLFELSHIDEFIDELLHEERSCDVILPRVQKRHVLEELNEIEARVSALDEDAESSESEAEQQSDSDMEELQKHNKRIDERSHKERENRGKKRHRSHSKERRHRSRSPTNKHRGRDNDHQSRSNRQDRDGRPRDRSHRHEKREVRDRHSDRGERNSLRDEIEEANALRAKLGMPPLRP